MLIINGCVCLETDLFNHSKGLFFNRALDKFSECQYNNVLSFSKVAGHSNGWSDIPSKKEANKKGGEKTMGGKVGRKKKKKKIKKKKEKRRSQQNERKERRKGEGRGGRR